VERQTVSEELALRGHARETKNMRWFRYWCYSSQIVSSEESGMIDVATCRSISTEREEKRVERSTGPEVKIMKAHREEKGVYIPPKPALWRHETVRPF
jgi:hypothetical protein